MSDIQYSRFAINETPYCFWDWNIAQQNVQFLDNLDPGYFKHLADIHGALLEGDEKQYAATTLRAAYSHALETLFALLSATVQAPDCVVAWLLKYRNNELDEVVRKIHNRQPVLSKLPVQHPTWETIADAILSFKTGNDDKDIEIRDAFAEFWERLADDFLKEHTSYEYNSIKHGLRVHMGGFKVAMGVENEPGIPASLENMRLVGSSVFGTAFYRPEPLGDKHNLRVKRQSVNWNPEKFVYALHLIALSIGNVISYLKCVNGVDPSEVQYTYPGDVSAFDLPWANQPLGITNFSMNSIIEPGWIHPLSRSDILAVYQEDRKHSTE
ncbi:MAG: hypothetical protein M3R24_39465 [Chloroflexota bacterium]|nr:hypothetical protein [Chloroflexota bacterium]